MWHTVVVPSVIGSYSLRSEPFYVLVMLVAACVRCVFITTEGSGVGTQGSGRSFGRRRSGRVNAGRLAARN